MLMINNEKVSKEKQKNHHFRGGMLLFLMKPSGPDIANMTRELSKVNNGANLAVIYELLRVIRGVRDTKNCGLKLEPTRNASKS